MCPKVFTIDCIINTVLEPDSLFIRFIDGDLAGMMARVSERNLEPASAGVSQ